MSAITTSNSNTKTALSDAEWLASASRFYVGSMVFSDGMDEWATIHIEATTSRENSLQWAVRSVDDRLILNNTGGWEDEPTPSERSDVFLKRTRFPTRDAAYAALSRSPDFRPATPAPVPPTRVR